MTDENAAVSREEENDDFESAFNEFVGMEEEDNKDEEQQEEQEEQEEPQQPDDVEQLKQELARVKQERNELEHSFKSQVGRVSALQKKLDGKKEQEEELGDLPVTEEEEEEEDELKEIRDYDPDFAKAIERVIEKRVSKVRQEVDSRFEPIQQQQMQNYINAQAAILDSQYQDWRQTIATQEYNQWLSEQPEPVQSMMNSSHAKDYAYLLDSYNRAHNKEDRQKEEADELTQRRQQKLASNVVVKSKGPSKKAIAPDDFDSAFEYYANKK